MSLPVIDEVLRWKKTLDASETPDADVVEVLTFLSKLEVDRSLLSKTKIGITVARLKHSNNPNVNSKAKQLVDSWKSTLGVKSRSTVSTRSFKTSPPEASSSESNTGTTDATNPRNTSHDHYDEVTSPKNAPFPGPYSSDPRRNKARQVLYKALVEGVAEDQLGEMDSQHAGQAAACTEEALWIYHVIKHNNIREYQVQLRSIKSNLADKKNSEFNIRVYLGAIAPQELAVMPSADMASDAKKRERQKAKKDALEACQSDWDLRNIKRAAGQFPCGKCKSQNTSYFQMQTRSSDEPMTTFVNCIDCGNRWKF